MGIFIYLKLSKSVTKEEWNSVYEESLKLVKAFPLAERGTISYAGHQIVCAVQIMIGNRKNSIAHIHCGEIKHKANYIICICYRLPA